MKTYKGLRGILAALALSLLAIAPAHAAPRLANLGGEPKATTGFGITVVPGTTITLECGGQTRGTKTYVDATSGTRTVVEWDLHAEAE